MIRDFGAVYSKLFLHSVFFLKLQIIIKYNISVMFYKASVNIFMCQV